jgi:signal transduction histidine kinase
MAKVLVIDDAPTNRDLITTLLGYCGHQSLEARDGREGLEVVYAERPDLVIVDLLMPTMNGYEFVSRVRRDPAIAQTPVVFYSASLQNEETRALAKACGVSQVLSKPTSPEEVVRVVEEALGAGKPPTLLSPENPSSAIEVVQVLNNRLFLNNKELQDLNARLEQRVAERTAELETANRRLREQIVEREKTEEGLRQFQRLEAVGRLAGGVAHDFNNLLGVILGQSEILLDRSLEDASIRGIEMIRKAAERGASLTRQLLAFSRQQVLESRIVDLNAVVTDLHSLLQRLIGEDIELVFRTDPKLGRVKADPGQLEQVIMNLAINARDAMPQGGKLTIATENAELDETYVDRHSMVQPGPYVVLVVSDNGCGMDAEILSHMFEPFFTTKELGKGTGLGLATVYGIVKQSGGYVWAYSEPGQGTSFKIYLPRVEAPADTPIPAEATGKPVRGSETILIVEDDDSLRELTGEFLQSSGYTVIEARRPDEALRISEQREGPIDFLLTDVIMPGMNGRQLAAQLASSRPKMKVLYISGYTDDAIMQHGLLEEGIAFLQKPYTRYALTRKVRDVLDSAPLRSDAKSIG